MKFVEIGKQRFDNLNHECEFLHDYYPNMSSIYFFNGCWFDTETDNIIAFPFYCLEADEPYKYFLVCL